MWAALLGILETGPHRASLKSDHFSMTSFLPAGTERRFKIGPESEAREIRVSGSRRALVRGQSEEKCECVEHLRLPQNATMPPKNDNDDAFSEYVANPAYQFYK